MHNKEEQDALRKNVLARMKRIEGQIRGIQKMIEDGKECEDILVQVRAVRSALTAASGLILKRYLVRCHGEALDDVEGDSRESLEKFIRVMTHFIDR
ncbi:metal-sensitive transcriptional regulator [Desulfolutivibrio sp.]|uniref:metal-sensitive transcriptional regulator n=1 Tax=Desulfolutivibrio sp. TaxID=2773296 RepID=UPI002F96B6D5